MVHRNGAARGVGFGPQAADGGGGALGEGDFPLVIERFEGHDRLIAGRGVVLTPEMGWKSAPSQIIRACRTAACSRLRACARL